MEEEGKLVACLLYSHQKAFNFFFGKEVLIYLNVVTVSNLKYFPGLVFQYHNVLVICCCLTDYHTQE